MANLRSAIAGVTLLLASAPALALDPTRSITQYDQHAWATTEGLPQSTILALAQTRDGYLWIGTEEGLVRFDGVRFTVFDTANTEGFTHNNVQAIAPDQEGNLWI